MKFAAFLRSKAPYLNNKKIWKVAFTATALVLAFLHIFFTSLGIDAITVLLLAMALLPWAYQFLPIESAEFGGLKLSFTRQSKKILSKDLSEKEKEHLKQQQVVLVEVGPAGYYKLYANGILTQGLTVKIPAGTAQHSISWPIAFPNEVISVNIEGNTGIIVTKQTPGGCTLKVPYGTEGITATFTAVGL
ncbi:hypothetical protein V8Z80_17215 [Orrella sp. JC864]|uniref:hypothetical protein n=1 Tax=Orrella sp. JC864 TaxID=3120298 RepID=UPI003008C774